MARKWMSAGYPGVRYRNHETRKTGRNPDRYYAIRYRPGKNQPQKEEGVGWSSEGWTPESVAKLLADIKHNIKNGEGFQSLEDKRAQVNEAKAARKRAEEAMGPQTITLSELFDSRYLDWAQTNKPGSWKDDMSRFNCHLRPKIGDKKLIEITKQDVEDLKAELLKTPRQSLGKGTLSPATVNQCLTLLRGIYYFAANTPYFDDDPDTMVFSGTNPAKMSKRYKSGIKPPKIRNHKERIFTDTEITEILDYTRERYPEMHDMIICTLDQGYRRAEIAGLEGQRVITADWSVIVDAKERTRRIYAGFHRPEAITILTERIERYGTGLLFPGRFGALRSVDNISERFKAITDELGINKGYTDRRFVLTFHDLRAWFCTKWFEAGAPAYSIMEQMGHESLETTMRYERLSDQKKRDLAMKAGGIIPGHH